MKIPITLLTVISLLFLIKSALAEGIMTHRCDTIKKDRTTATPSYNTPYPKFTYENVRDYIFSSLTYPPEAIQADIEGTVIVSFTIT